MLELLYKIAREALVKINFKRNLRIKTIRKRTNVIKKAHASIIKNLNILLGITLLNP